MFDTNPNLIQFGPPVATTTASTPSWASKTPAKPTPLILFHDGGGTIFSYYTLGDLNRPVFGIANPRYESGEPWEGGIPELASHYLRFVKEAVPDGGEVILGGWSLGGLVALELANHLATNEEAIKDNQLRVIGLVMIDSVCPLKGKSPPPPVVKHVVQWADHTKEETKARVLRCFENAVYMVDEQWTPPPWERKMADGEVREVYPPPVVLLKATEDVPVLEAGIAKIDIYRKDPRLGWDNYQRGLITRVIPIPGNHYNIFHTEETQQAATEAIKQACKEVEDINKSRKLFG